MRWVLVTGALLALLAVLVGAAAEHVLRPAADAADWRRIETAMAYHRFGALAVTALGLALMAGVRQQRRTLAAAACLLTAGTVLFSGTLYAGPLVSWSWLTSLTPWGGLLLILGWGVLAIGGLRHGLQGAP
ncbi:MAG: DUF423 domain-containing protein [Ectothiorhodospiraceae bacterium]